jgi:hypothetical protein
MPDNMAPELLTEAQAKAVLADRPTCLMCGRTVVLSTVDSVSFDERTGKRTVYWRLMCPSLKGFRGDLRRSVNLDYGHREERIGIAGYK